MYVLYNKEHVDIHITNIVYLLGLKVLRTIIVYFVKQVGMQSKQDKLKKQIDK